MTENEAKQNIIAYARIGARARICWRRKKNWRLSNMSLVDWEKRSYLVGTHA